MLLTPDETFHGSGKTSGVGIDQRVTHVWTVRDGVGISMESFIDRSTALVAVGRAG